MHTHIGSGVDPTAWQRAARLSLDLAAHFPAVDTLNLGGGYKVARMAHEEHSDLIEIGRSVREAFVSLFEETGRKLQLEIEPGTYLVANACSLLTTIQDIVTTGEEGYTFLKLDSGMSEILRPSHYGAEHPIIVISANPTGETREYVVVGHCCESGDLLTTAQGDPELLAPRELADASIGDLCVIEGAGAYCSSMPAKNYNSFPEASEALLRESGRIAAIRKTPDVGSDFGERSALSLKIRRIFRLANARRRRGRYPRHRLRDEVSRRDYRHARWSRG